MPSEGARRSPRSKTGSLSPLLVPLFVTMLIRVRSNVGVWRIEGLDDSATVGDVLAGIARTRPHVVYTAPLSSDPACRHELPPGVPLRNQGIGHGSMIHCRVDPATTVDVSAPPPSSSSAMMDEDGGGGNKAETAKKPNSNMRRVIGKDGQIQLVPTSEAPAEQERGFRPGMLPLRDMKMQWTLNDFIALDSQFEFKIQRQEDAFCREVSLDKPSIEEFQAYLQKFLFQRKRFGFLYGHFVKANEEDEKPTKVRVEAIYEPPQQVDNEAAEGFVVEDDPKEAIVEQIATGLGLQKVGWIFGHEAREPGHVLSAAEIIMTAEYQLEAAQGVEQTPFVTVTVAPKPDGTVGVEAFQVSTQCMAMVAEEALEIGEDPKVCMVNKTFTAIQEGKPSPTVDNNFFITVVPIAQHTSPTLIAEFPRANRDVDDRTPSSDEMRKQLQKSGTAGWTFEDRLSDFNLLVYLSDLLDVNADLPKICAAIQNKQPIDDGYKILIKSMAGMNGSY